MDKAKRTDRIKNLVIALLLLSALYLLYQAVFYETASTASPSDSGGESQTQNGQTGTAALYSKPAYVLVTGQDGTHTAAKCDRDAREKLLERFSAPLGEALGSAGDPKQVSTEEWQSALSGRGVFFDYLYPQPLSVIASSLGTTPKDEAGGTLSRRLCLSVAGSSVRLYYVSAADGSVFRCTTALSASSLTAKLGDYQAGKAKFAFEYGEQYAALDPCFIFSGEDATLAAVSASNPLTEGGELSKLFDAFGMSRASSGYIEKGGSFVYVESEKNLRVDNAGSVLFTVNSKSGVSIPHSGELTTAEIVSACADIAENNVGGCAGIAELVLSSCTVNDTTGETDVAFSYTVGGTPVTLSNGSPAATFKISGGTIVRAELYFRKYSYTGQTFSFLPEPQAAAIVQAEGGEPVLTYNDSDNGDGMTASWIVR